VYLWPHCGKLLKIPNPAMENCIFTAEKLVPSAANLVILDYFAIPKYRNVFRSVITFRISGKGNFLSFEW